jgi:hypothetical protein
MSFVFVGAGFMAFMAATTLAIDVGMFMTARSQAQASSDAAALAGATALVYNSWDNRTASGPAVQSALSAAGKNDVMQAPVSVVPTDVTFPLDAYGQANEVKVDVFRTAGRSNPLKTLIGPLFGISTVDIAATATAQAAPAGGMTCVKPFIIPDKWEEHSVPANDTFDRYDKKGNVIANADVYVPGHGYTMADRGTAMVLRAAKGSNIQPTFYFSWKMPSGTGADYYEENITQCNTTVVDLDYIATQEPGAMVGPTTAGLKDLMDQDPGAYWDPAKNDYVSSKRPSPRVFPIPLYNPDEYQGGKETGRTATLIVSNWMGFFLEDVKGDEAYGRIVPIVGTKALEGPSTSTPLAYVIRLVK